jgi:2-dehydropantoate 2-reductase
MDFAIIGSGALGGSYGGALARNGHKVSFFDVNEAHVAAINARGLSVKGVLGDFVVQGLATTDPGALPRVDAAIVLADTNAIKAAAKVAASCLKPDGFIVTIQNGIGNVEALAEAAGATRVFGGSTMNSAAFYGPGQVGHTNLGDTTIGELDGTTTTRLTRLATALDAAGMPVKVSDNIMGVIWSKFILNCAINPLTAIMGLRAGEILRSPHSGRLMVQVVDEALAVVKAKGITLANPDIRAYVLDHGFRRYNKPSMFQHVEQGRRTEIEALNGALVREARALGVPVPVNETIWRIVSGIDTRNARVKVMPVLDTVALEAAARDEPMPDF